MQNQRKLGEEGKHMAAMICRWPQGCGLNCPPFTYQPQAIPLAMGATERQGPASPRESLPLPP